MNKLKETFKKALRDLDTIDWSETDGSDIKEIFKIYFDNISEQKIEIKKLIEECEEFSNYEKHISKKILEEF